MRVLYANMALNGAVTAEEKKRRTARASFEVVATEKG
jgi:hypothetical protein